jgi:hypothetical protein
VSEPATSHTRLDELAAGYALHALGPDDQRRFTAHLPRCRRCQDAVGDYAEVTAALAETGVGRQPVPSPALRDRVLAALAAGQDPARQGAAPRNPAPQGPAHQDAARPAAPAPGGRHRGPRRWSRALLAAAAAVAVLAGGAAAWDSLAASGPAGQPPTAGCAAAGQCRELTLTSALTRRPAATVIIQGGTAWLVPAGLPADRPSRQVYVLWQLTGSRAARAIGAFDVSGHSREPIRIGSLPDPYPATRAFAVSLEPGRSIPARPSPAVALGTIAAPARP